MSASAVMVLLETLEEEDRIAVARYIEFLSASSRIRRAKRNEQLMEEIQDIIGEDRGWNSEVEMIEDMARFRREGVKHE